MNREAAEKAMRLAILEAKKAWGTTYPNPAVGALVLEEEAVIARGHTQPPGKAHAEVMALKAWREAGHAPTPDTTIVITLEPCSTYGRTPPCTDAIIKSGIRRVIVGAMDTNAAHIGRGFTLLRQAGVDVIDGVLAEACAALNPIFVQQITTGQPLIAAKIATTLDGKIATRSGASQWITGEAARADVHQWRRYFRAIGVGAGTVLTDNPSLTARLPGAAAQCPRRLIFDRRGHLASGEGLQAAVFHDAFAPRTIWITGESVAMPAIWANRGVTQWQLPQGNDFWPALRQRLADESLGGLYLEGGSQLLSDAFAAQAIDYLFAYRAPLIFGDAQAPSPVHALQPATPQDGIRLHKIQHETLGDDQLVRGWVTKDH